MKNLFFCGGKAPEPPVPTHWLRHYTTDYSTFGSRKTRAYRSIIKIETGRFHVQPNFISCNFTVSQYYDRRS